jgi:hypothetical protein
MEGLPWMAGPLSLDWKLSRRRAHKPHQPEQVRWPCSGGFVGEGPEAQQRWSGGGGFNNYEE